MSSCKMGPYYIVVDLNGIATINFQQIYLSFRGGDFLAPTTRFGYRADRYRWSDMGPLINDRKYRGNRFPPFPPL